MILGKATLKHRNAYKSRDFIESGKSGLLGRSFIMKIFHLGNEIKSSLINLGYLLMILHIRTCYLIAKQKKTISHE